MPELPEVETTRRGIAPHIANRRISELIIRHAKLRWPVPRDLNRKLAGEVIRAVERRAKYLLLTTDAGTLILHLGMSGSLRIVNTNQKPGKHDHVDIVFDNDKVLRLTDPRRFGAVLFTKEDPEKHELIAHLGPEPLGKSLSGDYLYSQSRGRKTAVKQFIMDGRIIVGVGNIYANEALFIAGINPKRAAGKIGRERYQQLVDAIKGVLSQAIKQGGTSLRDFVGGDGRPGYFAQELKVYGREGEACINCSKAIKQLRQGQRSTFYCPHCQK